MSHNKRRIVAIVSDDDEPIVARLVRNKTQPISESSSTSPLPVVLASASTVPSASSSSPVIWFKSDSATHRELSNFWPDVKGTPRSDTGLELTLTGDIPTFASDLLFRSSEHLYQYRQFDEGFRDHDYALQISKAEDAVTAKRMSSVTSYVAVLRMRLKTQSNWRQYYVLRRAWETHGSPCMKNGTPRVPTVTQLKVIATLAFYFGYR